MDIYSHYSVLRRPDGESDEASEDQMYETVNKLTETDRWVTGPMLLQLQMLLATKECDVPRLVSLQLNVGSDPKCSSEFEKF